LAIRKRRNSWGFGGKTYRKETIEGNLYVKRRIILKFLLKLLNGSGMDPRVSGKGRVVESCGRDIESKGSIK
jgi:hypothetical protein